MDRSEPTWTIGERRESKLRRFEILSWSNRNKQGNRAARA